MTLHTQIFGSGSSLTILHGLFGSSDNWRSIAKALGQRYRVTLVDLRNHGKSPHSEVWDLPSMANDVAELINQKNEKTILIGHSMGGKVAMELALSQPIHLNGLVVLDVAPKNYNMRERFQLIVDALISLPLNANKDLASADSHLAQTITEPSMRSFLLKNLTFQDGVYKWKMNLNIIAQNLEKIGQAPVAQHSYEGPTLFLHGGKSDYLLPSDHLGILRLFPNAKIETIPEAGHWLHVDQTQAFSHHLNSFLASVVTK
jgi:pimeloyl-ACP methyl ester carboxylesterase